MALNQEHYKLFKQETMKWIRKFGLTDFDTTFHFRKLEEGQFAGLNFDLESMTANFMLNKNWNVYKDNIYIMEQVKRSALHEACELLLCKLYNLAYRRFDVSKEVISEETHSIISRLENVFMSDHLEVKE